MVLFTSESRKWKRYTRLMAGSLVCLYVIFGGPVSGFGMNPARTFSSAFPSGIYTGIWIYMLVPVAGMLSAAEVFMVLKGKYPMNRLNEVVMSDLSNKEIKSF